jgi:hypothetical protein
VRSGHRGQPDRVTGVGRDAWFDEHEVEHASSLGGPSWLERVLVNSFAANIRL